MPRKRARKGGRLSKKKKLAIALAGVSLAGLASTGYALNKQLSSFNFGKVSLTGHLMRQ